MTDGTLDRLADLSAIELRHLRALRAVAECGTFGRAADALGYTQSAVSQQISSLEKAIGQKLFDRPGGPRPVEVTPAGALLNERAGSLLDGLAVTLADLEQLRLGERGRVRLGSFQSVSVHLAPPLLSRMRERLPLVDVELFESDDDDELERMLLAGELDATFLVASPEGNHEDIEWIDLLTDPYLVVVPAEEPEGSFAAEQLNQRPLIGNPAGVCERILAQGLRSAGIDPTYDFQTADNGAVHAMVANGMGVAVMPKLSIDPGYPGIAVRELSPAVAQRRVSIAHRAGTPGPLTRAVTETAVEVVKDMGLFG